MKRWFEPKPPRPRTLEDVKRDGILSVDRDWAVAQNMDVIRKMIRPGNVKEIHMAKRKVKFKTTDGMQPRKLEAAGKPFGLRLPMAINLASRTSKVVRLGISCELPVIVVGKLKTELFGPGQELSVEISADSDPLSLGDGEIVAQAFVVDNTELELA